MPLVYVDSYCERTAPGLWNEPLNAVSNLAFLIAAALLFWLLRRQPRRVPVSLWLLPSLIAVVGVCSWTFHMAATAPTAALDSLSILVFILVATVVLVHWQWGVRWSWAWLAAPAFVVFSVAVDAALFAAGGEDASLGGYLPALLALVGFGVVAIRAPEGRHGPGQILLAGGAVFAVSLTLRTIDGPVCATMPIGTHFLWHCCNAAVLFLVTFAIQRSQTLRTDGGLS